jgi:cytochrome c551/c552
MKPRLSRVSLRIAALALGTLAAVGAQAQNAANGRLLFKQKNCALCHFYEARSIAPSVKKMKVAFKGDPARTAAAISAAAGHAGEIKSWSANEIHAISEWLAATSFEQQAAAEAAKPKPGSPEAKALAKKEAAAKAKAAAEAKAKARQEAAAKARQEAEARAQARKEAAAKARQDADAKAQARKDAAAKAAQEAEAKAQAKRDAEAQAAREAAAKKEKADLARREAEAKARKDSAALDAIKRESDERAKREAEAQAAAKRDAEARAKREADALAAQKREAEERARRDAEAKAKAEALAAQKREAEAQAKKPDVAAKVEPAAKDEAAKPGGRKKIAYRDGSDLPPCAPPTGAPLGTVDEAAAKAIIDRVGCPQCHAYVQKKTGPPMKNIQEKYKGDWECVVSRLTKNKTHKEEGVTDDLKGNEFKIVADYIATRNK